MPVLKVGFIPIKFPTQYHALYYFSTIFTNTMTYHSTKRNLCQVLSTHVNCRHDKFSNSTLPTNVVTNQKLNWIQLQEAIFKLTGEKKPLFQLK